METVLLDLIFFFWAQQTFFKCRQASFNQPVDAICEPRASFGYTYNHV